VLALTVNTGGGAGATVTGALVASRTQLPCLYSRNSYCPALAGAVTVHVRVVTPAPTYWNCR
jgi:hypothetical protein